MRVHRLTSTYCCSFISAVSLEGRNHQPPDHQLPSVKLSQRHRVFSQSVSQSVSQVFSQSVAAWYLSVCHGPPSISESPSVSVTPSYQTRVTARRRPATGASVTAAGASVTVRRARPPLRVTACDERPLEPEVVRPTRQEVRQMAGRAAPNGAPAEVGCTPAAAAVKSAEKRQHGDVRQDSPCSAHAQPIFSPYSGHLRTS